MPCFHPKKAIKDSSGVKILPPDAPLWSFMLPCGQCNGCRLQRSREWGMRVMHEAQLWRDNCFITLTYDDAHVPLDGGLHHRHFQLFFKRLRKNHPGLNIRYYMCGEYGENYGRPHFHACIFNWKPSDLVLWKKTSADSLIYRSAELEKLWPYGFSSVGDLTLQSAMYVSRYIMQKVTGDAGKHHYEVLDPFTGEIFNRRPEYNKMSTKPGIGAGWFNRFKSDVYPHDYVVLDGNPSSKPPRYYDKLLKRSDPDLYDAIKEKRVLDNIEFNPDNTPRRLADREQVSLARVSKLKRGFS